MVKARRGFLWILTAAVFTLLLLIGCSREAAPQRYISNVCYILNENDFYEFQIPEGELYVKPYVFKNCGSLGSANTVFNSKNWVIYYTENNSVWITPEGKMSD